MNAPLSGFLSNFLPCVRAAAVRFARRAQDALMLSLAACAPALMLLCRHAPQALPVFWRFPAAAILLTALCMGFSGRRRIAAAALSLAALLALGGLSLPLRAQPALLLLPLGACAVLLAALPFAAGSMTERRPAVYTVGLFVQLGANALALLSERLPRPQYSAVLPAMTLAFAVYLLLCMLVMNQASLRSAVMGRHQVPGAIRRFNTVLVLGFMVLALLLASIPALARAITAAWDALCAAAARLLRWLSSILPEASPMGVPGEGGAPSMEMLPIEETEPSLLAVILERAAMVFAALVLLVLLALAARIVARRLRALLAALLDRLQRYVAAAAGEEDEITDTRGEDAERRRVLPGFARRRPEHDPKTPAGRIRFAYLRLLRRNADWADSSTARENLPQDAAALYEQARYSAHPVTDADAERFSAGAKRL